RVVTLSRPAGVEDPARAAARGGVEGFVRSLAHEMRGGGTANGVTVEDGVPLDAPGAIGAIRLLLSSRSAFVTGQFLHVSTAARGAELVVLDVPGAGTELSRLANELRAVPIQLDVTSRGAGRRLVSSLRERGLTLDAVVLNAGITRDKTLANMTPERWDPVLAVNISSQITLTEALIEAGDVLGEQPRVVSLASTSGIAGNRGQTNYATSKAGVIAFVDALAERLERIGGTANAVAPGFIETEMTARMPALTREIAR